MNVIMPQLGETVAEGKIGKWFKSVGDQVKAGENLFEIETDKVAMEVQATESGVLTEIRVGEGQTVPVGAVVAVLGNKGDAKTAPAPAAKAPAAPAKAAAAPARAPAPAVAKSNGTRRPLKPFDEVHTPTGDYGPAKAPLGLKVTPLARRLIKQQGLDLEAIARGVQQRGGWRIAARDVHQVPAAGPSARPVVALREGDRVETLTRARAMTASRLAEAWRTAPHVFQAVEVDFSAVERARQAAKAAFAERHKVALTYLPFIARATCLAIAEFPRINASFDRDRLIVHGDVNLGIAVDLNHEGLIVPVIHHADEMTAGGLAKAIARLVEKARAGKMAPGDFEGGTYTITNNGSFGTVFTAPIINVPQVAILSTDAVRKRAVVIEGGGGDAIAVRPVGMVGQSFDHRAFDGAYSASFLGKLKQILETRDWNSELI
ncbi:MAG TPA: dihydrolipoamide acetyltransferase family protein [Alphaproteobacteria bacterium]|nr:dihydrolipoamide acetyltransferase family protein [Alphaproteobacteria bacterium]